MHHLQKQNLRHLLAEGEEKLQSLLVAKEVRCKG
jgi:hypothetical protein